MQIHETEINGCYELQPIVRADNRGTFVKILHRSTFESMGLETDFPEEYYSESQPRVIRGLHFQTPPADHIKVVNCISGKVIDVVLDLRKNSPSYLKHMQLELDSKKGNMIYIPRGVAHGFCVPDTPSFVLYRVSSEHSPENDGGVAWDSAGIDWPIDNPILSDRDRALPPLQEFNNPF